MSVISDHYISGLLDHRAEVQNLINTALCSLSDESLTEHERLERYAVLGKLRSELGQANQQLESIKVNHRINSFLSTI